MDPTVLGCLDPDGRYPLIRKIGWGKWATMYTAIDTVTKEEVVVKCMKLYDIDVAARDHLLTYLQREVDNHSRLNHPNIINVKGAFLGTIPYQPHAQQHTHFCLVLELASAGNLLQHYQDYYSVFRSSFPPVRARSFLQQLVLALEYLHSVGLSHRDIKPDNIVLKVDPGCPMPLLKLADFGVSSNCDDTPNRVTSVVGTRLYYAPEMLVKERRELLVSRLQHLSLSREGQQRNYEAQSRTQEVLNQLPNIDQAQNAPQDSDRLLYDGTKIDMWSCGMVFYYMLTGEPAFGAKAVDNTWQDMPFDAHIQQMQAGPRLNDHEVFNIEPHGPHLRQLLTALLEFNPHHRPSIEQLRSAQFFPWFAEGLPAAHSPSGQEQGPQALRPVRFERVKSALTSVVEDARKILMNQAAQPHGMMVVVP